MIHQVMLVSDVSVLYADINVNDVSQSTFVDAYTGVREKVCGTHPANAAAIREYHSQYLADTYRTCEGCGGSGCLDCDGNGYILAA